MADNDLFTSSDDNQSSITKPDNYYEHLVGEGKKFKDNETLARGKYESDLYVAQLQKELDGIRQELNTRMTLEEFWEKTSTQGKTKTNGEAPDNQGVEQRSQNQVSAPKPEEITDLVRRELSEERTKTQKAQNLAYVEQELTKALGPNFRATLKEKAQELGASVDFLGSMAETAPKAFITLMTGGTPKESSRQADTSTPPRSQINTQGMARDTGKGFQYFEKLRKDNPSAYWSPKVQNEMFKTAKEMGESFYKS